MLTNLLWIQKASDSCGAQLRQCQIKLCFFICAWISKTFFQRAKIFFSCFFFSFCFWNQQTPWKLKISTIFLFLNYWQWPRPRLRLEKRRCVHVHIYLPNIYVYMYICDALRNRPFYLKHFFKQQRYSYAVCAFVAVIIIQYQWNFFFFFNFL